jgi:hypothetical protein
MLIAREELLEQLESCEAGLAKKEVLEQTGSFVFRDGFIYTFNDERACRRKTQIDFNGAVQAETLLNVLRKMKETELSLDVKDSTLYVKGKSKRSTIKMNHQILIPIDSIERPTKRDWNDLDPAFTEAIGLVDPCASDTVSDTVFSSIHITPDFVEACDGKQAARYTMTTGVSESCLVRKGYLKQVLAHGMTKIAETRAWLHFKNPNGLVISCRRFVEKYSDKVDALFEPDEGVNIVLPKGIIESIDLADVFSSNTTETDNEIRVSLEEGKLTLRGSGSMGEYREDMKIAYDDSPVAFAITPSILQDVVKRHNECMICERSLRVETANFIYITSIKVL